MVQKTLFNPAKGDKFLVRDGNGSIVRGVTYVDLIAGEYGVIYIGDPSVINHTRGKRNLKLFYRVVQEKFTVEFPYNGPLNRLEFLVQLVNRYGWVSGAEIGVNRGYTTFGLIKSCPHLKMTAVDFWPKPFNHQRNPFKQSLKKLGGDRIKLIELPSLEAAIEVEDESLDFVFIDALHTEQGCHDDIKAWFPKLRPTGMLLGHDSNWSGVRNAVQRLLGSNYQVWDIDNVWFTWKKDHPCETESLILQ